MIENPKDETIEWLARNNASVHYSAYKYAVEMRVEVNWGGKRLSSVAAVSKLEAKEGVLDMYDLRLAEAVERLRHLAGKVSE